MGNNQLTQAIIGAAVEVRKRMGPGLLESAYRACLAYELRKRGFNVMEENLVPVLRLLNLRVGLLINFHEEKLVDGVHRIINGY